MNRHVKPPRIDADAFETYRVSGWGPIPLHPWDSRTIGKRGKSRSDGKRPRDFDWTHRAYDPAKVIATCIRGNRNMGIRLMDRQLVVDVDPRNGGDNSFNRLSRELGLKPADWPRVETGSGGSHYYLTLPEGVRVLDTLESYPGVEFKSVGRQVVAAGSIHPDTGRQYFWDTLDHPPLADAPEGPASLIEAIRRPERFHEPAKGGEYSTEVVARMLDSMDPADFRDHDKWLRLMMAAHHASGGDARAEFVDWSTSDPEYARDGDEIGRRWDSLHAERDDGVTAATLRKYVQDHSDPSTIPPDDASADFAGEDVDTNAGDDDSDYRPSRFKALKLSELRNAPDLIYLISGLIPAGCLIELFGRPKSGKTFSAIDMGLSIATGAEFHGLKVAQGRVLHIIGEGNKRAFSYRIEAWITSRCSGDPERKAELDRLVEANFEVLPLPMHCDVAGEVKAFLAANPGSWSMIVVDTLMRNMTGHISDPKDMAAFVRGCDYIREKTCACVLIVHHEGKDKSKGGMGSTNLEASVDGVLYFERKGDRRVLSVALARDGADDLPDMIFELESIPVKLVFTDDGEKEIRSAVLKLMGRAARPKRRELNLADKVLLAIYHTNAKRQEDIAGACGVTRQAISKLLPMLRQQGLIAEKGLTLTDEGRGDAEALLEADEAV